MNYPPAPWQLRGNATQTLNLVDIDRVRRFVPPELDIVAILPGKTIGSIYISEYQLGSVLTYNELIVAPALVRDRAKIGGWISHIYVDNPDSVAGGREIWGLPKELAQFTRFVGVGVGVGEASACAEAFAVPNGRLTPTAKASSRNETLRVGNACALRLRNENRHITVKQQDNILCSLSYQPNLLSEIKIPLKITVPCFGNLTGNLLYFHNDVQGKISTIDSKLEIPESSPFASLDLSAPLATIDLQDLYLVTGSPEYTSTRLENLAIG